MPTVTPPPASSSSPSVAPSATGGVTPVEAGIGNAPDKIQQLARQIQVSGLITAPPDGGEITLSTVIGTLTILLPQLAKDQQDKLIQQLLVLYQTQKPLTVVVQPGNPPAQAFLLLPPPASTAGTASAAAQTSILFQAVTPPLPVTPGTVLPAVVLPPNITPPNLAVPSPLPQPLPPGIPPQTGIAPPSLPLPTEEEFAVLTDLAFLNELAAKAEAMANQIIPEAQAKILAYETQAQAPNFAPQTAPSTPVSSLVTSAQPPLITPQPVLNEPSLPQVIPVALEDFPVAPSVLPQTSSAVPPSLAAPPLAALFQPGTEVTLRVDAVALPSAPLPVLSAPNQILATVTGTGPGGQLLVQAGDTTLYIKQSVNAPVGSTLLVTVSAARQQPLTPLPLLDADNFNPLQQALAQLAQADPQLARQVIENVIPQPNAALGGALLFLLSAFRQGDVRSWLGNNAVDILTRAGKMELIAHLAQQLSEGGQTTQDSVVGAWRSYTVPLHANNQFQTLHLYVHNDGDRKGEGGDKSAVNAVRFLIDMRLSRLGALQLDGFVRPRKLDMIVRSEKLLPEGLNQDLRQTYIKALDAVRYAGTLNFQIGRQNWLHFRKAAGAGSVEA